MRERLQNTHDVIKERYKWVVRHVGDLETACHIRIPAGADRRFSAAEYIEILKVCESSLRYLRQEYSRVAKWVDQRI
jgi:hypothetical protein